MPPPSRRAKVILAAVLVLLARAAPVEAADPPLGAYNADPAESSVSGISSGGFMAAQLATAFSATFKGVGVIAGGPFGCAQPSGLTPGLSIVTALGPCMKGDPAPDAATLIRQAEALAETHDIDPTDNLRRQKIYLFHGYNDTIVAESVTAAAAAFYRHYLGEAGRGNLFYQTSYGAGHSQVTLDWGLDCPSNGGYFIDRCGYDQAGVLLRHIYGGLDERNGGVLTGSLLPFDQGRFTPLDPGIYGLADTGYVYVPAACAAQEACRVHVALHGCLQDAEDVGDKYVGHAGYNEWADNNHIIVLYPQTRRIGPVGQDPLAWNPLLVNPQACWDWWGYHDFSNGYLTHDGPQMAAIRAMLAALTAGFRPGPPAPAGAAAAPDGLALVDVSDSAAALAWQAVPGATSYRVYRATRAEGPFVLAGSVSGPSFGDAGLAPRTGYVWQVSATVGGVEGPRLAGVAGTTRATPAPCGVPGACPITAE